jgi:hypothetical protein
MKRFGAVMIVAAIAAIGFTTPVGAKGGGQRNFVAPLSGGEEVPPVATQATGVAKFQLSKDGSQLSYKINVANMQGVAAAHIHCAPAGVNGPVGVTLFAGPPAGPVQGTLVQGVITAPDPANGCGWADLASAVASMRSGATYVNVHTIPPGVPSGEVRGQVK